MQGMHGFAWNACILLHGTGHSQHHTNNKNFINQWNQPLLSTTSNDALFTYNCLSAKKIQVQYEWSACKACMRLATSFSTAQHTTLLFMKPTIIVKQIK
jgi:hypothetical protein